MKIFLFLLFAANCWLGVAQNQERITIKGKVIVESEDLEGITVYNTSSNQGTTTNEKGEFTIAVMINDVLEFGALQFEDFEVRIDESITKTRQLTVYLVEQVNRLDEVLILPYNLTGNLEEDIASIRTFNPDMDAIYFGIQNSDEYEFADDNRSAVSNPAMHSQGQPMIVNGLNIKNVVKLLISPLLNAKARIGQDVVLVKEEEQPEQLKDYYSVAFINNNFDIPTDRVDDFIVYVKDNGLQPSMLEDGNEMQLLQFMYAKRDEFLAKNEED